MIIWGTKLYGKVDEIEGLGFVATQFGHLFWIPLIPLQSYFVTHEDRHNFEGKPLGLELKSVLVGYGRAFSILFFLAGLGGLNTLLNPQEVADPEKMTTYKTMIAMGAFSIPMFIVSYLRSVRCANYETASLLSKRLGFDDRLRTYIEFSYDKISEAEAEQRIDALESGAPDDVKWGDEINVSDIYERYASV